MSVESADLTEARKAAYRTLLSAAMLHLKWELAGISGPFSCLKLHHQIETAAQRSFTFHNLALFVDEDFEGFEEERFWRCIEEFQRKCPNAANSNYQWLFERLLAGEKVSPQRPLPPIEGRNRHERNL